MRTIRQKARRSSFLCFKEQGKIKSVEKKKQGAKMQKLDKIKPVTVQDQQLK